ncbi:hypothetical protein NMY22_g11360 [Coprinellus aureogranulatus]|nr:hypothetical protein NMY22_g11360 [Coprinellus aureogranulatus]
MSRRIVEDDDYDDESEDTAAVARRLRASRPIDYAESDVEESDEDELMIGNEDDREGVYGSSKPSRRTKPRTSNVGPPSKKRKVSSRPQQ